MGQRGWRLPTKWFLLGRGELGTPQPQLAGLKDELHKSGEFLNLVTVKTYVRGGLVARKDKKLGVIHGGR